MQVHGHKVSMAEMADLIDRVSLTDLFRVANRVLRPSTSPILSDRKRNGLPTVVAQGKLRGMPDVTDALKRRGLAGAE